MEGWEGGDFVDEDDFGDRCLVSVGGEVLETVFVDDGSAGIETGGIEVSFTFDCDESEAPLFFLPFLVDAAVAFLPIVGFERRTNKKFEEEAQLNPDEQCLGHNHEKEERKN